MRSTTASASISSRSLPKQSPWHLNDRAIQNLFIWPTLILLIAMNVFPLLYSLYLSFTNYSAVANKPPLWVGLKNFADILMSEQMWDYFATTGRYALMDVGLQTVIGFGLAMLLRRKFFGSGMITTLILVPMMISPVVVGLFWKLIYNPNFGFFNYAALDPRVRLAAVVQVVDPFRLPGRQQAEELRTFQLQVDRLAPPIVVEPVLVGEVDHERLAVEEAEEGALGDRRPGVDRLVVVGDRTDLDQIKVGVAHGIDLRPRTPPRATARRLTAHPGRGRTVLRQKG